MPGPSCRFGRGAYVNGVKKHAPASAVPMMMAHLAIASWETIFYRSLLMAKGACSISEYQRMYLEKAAATQSAALAVLGGKGDAAVLSPYLSRARANARRLRRTV
jgi:hypothetical protein